MQTAVSIKLYTFDIVSSHSCTADLYQYVLHSVTWIYLTTSFVISIHRSLIYSPEQEWVEQFQPRILFSNKSWHAILPRCISKTAVERFHLRQGKHTNTRKYKHPGLLTDSTCVYLEYIIILCILYSWKVIPTSSSKVCLTEQGNGVFYPFPVDSVTH